MRLIRRSFASTRLPPIISSKQSLQQLLDRTDVFLFDCDGVMWKGNGLIEGADKAVLWLRSLNKEVYFVTNNSTKSRQGYEKKFADLGMGWVKSDRVYTTSYAAAMFLKESPLFDASSRSAYVLSSGVGLGEELDLAGVRHAGGVADRHRTVDFATTTHLQHDPAVGAVVVGKDTGLNYYKIQQAQLCVNTNPGCLFVATNTDATANLTDHPQQWAGSGATVGAIQGCTRAPDVVCGKPSALMLDLILRTSGLGRGYERSRMCMVGDR